MFQCQPRRSLVIQHNVGHSFDARMTRHRHGWKHQRFFDRRVRRDKPFHSTCQQHMCISLQQSRVVPVKHYQEEVIIFSKVFFDAADHHRTVGGADLFGNHPYRIRPFQPQRAREKIRPVIQFTRRGDNALFGVFGDGPRCGRIVQCCGDCPWSQSCVLRNGLAGGLIGSARACFSFRRERSHPKVLSESSKSRIGGKHQFLRGILIILSVEYHYFCLTNFQQGCKDPLVGKH
jgi:hypothetical protein